MNDDLKAELRKLTLELDFDIMIGESNKEVDAEILRLRRYYRTVSRFYWDGHDRWNWFWNAEFTNNIIAPFQIASLVLSGVLIVVGLLVTLYG